MTNSDYAIVALAILLGTFALIGTVAEIAARRNHKKGTDL